MTLKSNTDYWKYLGHLTNNNGDSKEMMDSLMHEEIEPQIEYMKPKKMSHRAVYETLKTLIDSKILYKLQFATINEEKKRIMNSILINQLGHNLIYLE